jgi:hypothetical protein
MALRIVFLITVIIIPFSSLHSLGKKDPESVSRVREVELIDKEYRTLAILPFDNLTGDDHYSYISRTVQNFTADHLSVIESISITTDDYVLSEELRTNRDLKFSYGTNFERKMIILDPAEVYRDYIQYPQPGNWKGLAAEIKADYLVGGQYKLKKGFKDRFDLFYSVYNAARDEIMFEQEGVLDHRKIARGIEQMSTKIVRSFYPSDTGMMRVATDLSNFQIYLDGRLRTAEGDLFRLPAGRRRVEFRTLSSPPIEKEVIIQSGRTSTVSLYQKEMDRARSVLQADSDPPGADLYLNVKHMGQTPLSTSNLLPGRYRIKAARTNYNSVFRIVDLEEGLNTFSFSLERIRSPEYYQALHKRNKRWMYIFLGAGGAFLLGTYYFYIKAEEEYDRHRYAVQTGNLPASEEHYDQYRDYMLVTQIGMVASVGSLGLSLLYFFKVLDYDDAHIGMHGSASFGEVACQGDNQYFLLKYRW